MRIILFLLIGLSGLASAHFARAQGQCFCLASPATGNVVRFGCEARSIPNRVSERVVCQSQDLTSIEAVLNHADFVRVLAGEGACNPCRAAPCPTGVDCNPDIPRLPESKTPEEVSRGD